MWLLPWVLNSLLPLSPKRKESGTLIKWVSKFISSCKGVIYDLMKRLFHRPQSVLTVVLCMHLPVREGSSASICMNWLITTLLCVASRGREGLFICAWRLKRDRMGHCQYFTWLHGWGMNARGFRSWACTELSFLFRSGGERVQQRAGSEGAPEPQDCTSGQVHSYILILGVGIGTEEWWLLLK